MYVCMYLYRLWMYVHDMNINTQDQCKQRCWNLFTHIIIIYLNKVILFTHIIMYLNKVILKR